MEVATLMPNSTWLNQGENKYLKQLPNFFFFFVKGSMKYQTLQISLAKQKQSDHKQILL